MKKWDGTKKFFNSIDVNDFNVFCGICSILGLVLAVFSFIGINLTNFTYLYSISKVIYDHLGKILMSVAMIILFSQAIKYRASAIIKMNVSSTVFWHVISRTRSFQESIAESQIDEIRRCSGKCDALKELARKNLNTSFLYYTIDILDNVVQIMEGYTGCEIAACVKLVVSKETDKVITIARDRISNDKRAHRVKTKAVPIKANSDFNDIVNEGNNSFFYVSNLKRYSTRIEDVSGGLHRYLNSSLDWQKHYIGTAVVPIGNTQGEKYQVVGFLCVDSLNSKAFKMKQKDINIKLLKSFSDTYGMAVKTYLEKQKEIELWDGGTTPVKKHRRHSRNKKGGK